MGRTTKKKVKRKVKRVKLNIVLQQRSGTFIVVRNRKSRKLYDMRWWRIIHCPILARGPERTYCIKGG